jgi:hypothetical protein
MDDQVKTPADILRLAQQLRDDRNEAQEEEMLTTAVNHLRLDTLWVGEQTLMALAAILAELQRKDS